MSIILNVINYFWKIGFNEEAPDLYVKAYPSGTRFEIDMTAETFDYGSEVMVSAPELTRFSQKNFVVMESLDRLLRSGWPASGLHLGALDGADYTVSLGVHGGRLAVRCTIWEDEYDDQVREISSRSEIPPQLSEDCQGLVLYTSRLKAGTIEHRHTTFSRRHWSGDQANGLPSRAEAIFEEAGRASRGVDSRMRGTRKEDGFTTRDGVLVEYLGGQEHVVVPAYVERLKNSVFWNNETMREVTLPEGIWSLGGDTFYNCVSLTHLVIPASVEIVGDNPFANCPMLTLENRSPFFHYENGLLLNREGTRLIYCSIRESGREVVIPDGVISVGKHAFYNCRNLERIVLPRSVKIIENNPFSNLPLLRLENRSPHFVFQEGALYNKTFGTLFYYEQGWEADKLEIPEGVRIIGRHSFYNCRRLRRLSIPESVTTIGYNPFAGCSSLRLECRSPAYVYRDGALYNHDMTELISYSIAGPSEEFIVPSGVRKIGRSAFFMGENLRHVRLPAGLTIIERSAFAGCSNLRSVNLPPTVVSIGEWAFSRCGVLERLDLPSNATVEAHTFLGCPANFILEEPR